MNVVAALKRKFGPLPAWGWGLALAGVLLVYRRLHGPAAVTTAAATDLGAAAGNGVSDPNGIGAFGGGGSGGGSGGLAPSDQTVASPDLSGPGTPIIFDPLGDMSGGDGGGSNNDTGGGTGAGVGSNDTIDPGEIRGTARGRHAPTGFGGSSTKPAARPKSSKGQRTKRSRHASIELVSEHGAGQVHPASAAHKAPAPARSQAHAAPAPVVHRSTSAAHVDTGARTPAPVKKAPPLPPAWNVHRPGRQM